MSDSDRAGKQILQAVSQNVNRVMKQADKIDTRCPHCGEPISVEKAEDNDNSADKSGDKE